MKRIILLSGFVLTQTIFATTLTIYNSNIALVQESQEFEINKTDRELEYANIPTTLVNDSVDIELPKAVKLYSQIYRRKNLTQHDLAKEFIEKQVALDNRSNVTLLALSGNNAIVKTEEGSIKTVKVADILFPSLPQNLQAHNSLTFQIKSSKTLKANVDISYLAQNISFSTDYVLNLNKNRADLTSWVNIVNNSGKDFKNTRVNLVAGEINRAYNHPTPLAYRAKMLAADTASITHKAVAGYHHYTLPRKIDLNSYEKQRIKLFAHNEIAIKNNYIATMNNPLYLMGERSSSVKREIALQALNNELPAGLVRIYTKDAEEKLLLGESNIANMPKNTPITLTVGTDFDTKVIQRMRSRNDTNTHFDATIEYTVRNNSDEDKLVTLHIPFNKKRGSHISSKLKYVYTKGNLVTFTLKIKANSKRSFDVNFKSSRR